MDFSRKQGSQQMDKSPQNFSKSPKASSSFRDRTQEVYKTSQSDRNQPNRSRSSKWKVSHFYPFLAEFELFEA